jgi:hypothetical protein
MSIKKNPNICLFSLNHGLKEVIGPGSLPESDGPKRTAGPVMVLPLLRLSVSGDNQRPAGKIGSVGFH